MTGFLQEFKVIASQGGFAIWALIVVSILLYGSLATIASRLLRLRDLEHGRLPETVRRDLAEARDRRQVPRLFALLELEKLAVIQRRLPFVAILTGVAPLTGLLGTVSGMLVTFTGLADSSAAKPIEKISAGVSEALITTQAGLIIAIPAAICTALLGAWASRTEGAVQKLLHQHLAQHSKIS